MTDKQAKELLEMVLGTLMMNHSLCEFLIERGTIDRTALVNHLAAKRVSWEQTASANALFPIDMISALLAGKKMPAPPVSLH
jgi:hypothetical protein